MLNEDYNIGDKTITIGPSGYLVEDSVFISATTGTITTTRDLNDISENVGGLGADITTSASMGSTTITRSHVAGSDPTSIKESTR